ncbi:hypothetical protein GT347_21450 [Xylophilus rhododendri]|uniref:DUF5666 domain-containing protein n=1 Tax=Xylophilus rhododendri TaxID=2697032 RepID=A0A857J8W4_9BURK|nr:hypothetical protein [Xylophilus rhododendri]QHJ00317.1 hypothetical protein GT347_21450 [Xylophilus rhododendri]
MRYFTRSTLVLAASLAAFAATGLVSVQAQSAAAQAADEKPVRLRGTLEKADANTITVKDRGGETVVLQRPPGMPIAEVFPVSLSDIRPNSYIGTAALPQPDGTQRALEVVIFPEAARGTGEGHHAWDLMPESTMTNATVEGVSAAPSDVPGGQKLVLKYKGGEKTVIVPRDVPVVSFKPGTPDLLVPGAKVLVNAQMKDGKPTAVRVMTGRDGFAPPM